MTAQVRGREEGSPTRPEPDTNLSVGKGLLSEAARRGAVLRRRGQGGAGVNSAPQNSISAVRSLSSFKVSVRPSRLMSS